MKLSDTLWLTNIPTFKIENWGVCFDDQTFCISVLTGLIVEMLFILFSIYNTAKWAENE